MKTEPHCMSWGHVMLTIYTAFKEVVMNPDLQFLYYLHREKMGGKKVTQNCLANCNTAEK